MHKAITAILMGLGVGVGAAGLHGMFNDKPYIGAAFIHIGILYVLYIWVGSTRLTLYKLMDILIRYMDKMSKLDK